MVANGCEECKYMIEKGHNPIGTKRDGWCHKKPPVVVSTTTIWPLIRNIEAPENWCGCFEKDPKKKVAGSKSTPPT